MAATDFLAELGDELVFEGGFSDDAADPGGATDHGITLATFSHWLGRPASIAELQAMTPAQEAAIYRSLFWNVIQGDALPAGVDLEVFDMAVNGGPRRAAAMLQQIVGAVVDGTIGPKTLAAVSAVSSVTAIGEYSTARQAYYRSLPTFARFGVGWLNRVAKCRALALGLAAA